MRTLLVLIAVISMAGSVSAEMIAHWEFDEGSGQTAYDSAGSNNGTIYGATWTAGKIGGALSFNGTDSYVNVLDDPSLRFDQYDSFSISYWAKSQPLTDGRYVISKMRASGSGVFGYASGYYAPEGQFTFLAEKSDKGYVNLMTQIDAAPADSWAFVTTVYDNKNMKIYVNGELENTGTFTFDTGATVPTQDLCIGAWAYDTSRDHYFKGFIDDVRIYNNALTAGEIQALYVPEPATLLLLGVGAFMLRRKK
jgi:hypothetical protein